MTTDEVNQLINNEIYENQVGHITGSILSSVLIAINKKKIDFYNDLSGDFSTNLFKSVAGQLYALPYSCGDGNGGKYFKSAIFASVVNELKSSNYTFQPGYGETVEFVTALMNNIGFQYKENGNQLSEFRNGISTAVLEHYVNNEAFASAFTNQIGLNYLHYGGYPVYGEFASGISTAILEHCVRDQGFASYLASALRSYL